MNKILAAGIWLVAAMPVVALTSDPLAEKAIEAFKGSKVVQEQQRQSIETFEPREAFEPREELDLPFSIQNSHITTEKLSLGSISASLLYSYRVNGHRTAHYLVTQQVLDQRSERPEPATDMEWRFTIPAIVRVVSGTADRPGLIETRVELVPMQKIKDLYDLIQED